MATIASAIRLTDQMSAPIRSINNAMNMMLSTWTDLEASTASGLDIGSVESIRAEINNANRALDQLEQNQQDFNQEVQNGNNALDGLTGKIMGAVGAFAGMQGIKQLVSMSDTFTQTTARLNMINDGTQTTEELFDKIYASANRAHAPITQMADTVAKLQLNAGDAFGSNDETILFAENLNKLFSVAGTDQASIASASLQLTQALGSGVLRGEEFNAVFEAAPNIMQTVADYMDVPIGKLRGMAAEGKITADIVKNALIGSTEEINAQFESMPLTWADVWTDITNKLYYASIPILEVINLLANNWSIIEPIVLGVAAAIGLYTAALLINTAITSGSALVQSVQAAATMMQTGATFAATAAQHGFNAALLASPITWIIIGIIAIVAALYAVVAAINKTQDTTISATGIITGVVWSMVSHLWNIVAAFVNFFANVWTDPIGSIARLFGDLADNILGMLELIAKGIDAVFGSDLQSTVAGWRSGLSGMIEEKYGAGLEIMPKMDAIDAFDTGYEFGQGIDEKVSGFFGGMGDKYNLDNLTESVNNLGTNAGDIAGNTGAIKDSLDITGEDLKFMRDIAEQEVINRFTTAEIKVDMGGVTNQVNSNVDLDGVIDYMVDSVQEAMDKVAEGAQLMYFLYLGGVLFPITPKKFTLKIKNQNKTMNLINEGQINFLKEAGLTDVDFEALIPQVEYSFARYDGGFQPASWFLGKFNAMKTGKKPVSLVMVRQLPGGKTLYPTNMSVSVEDYTVTEDEGEGFDLKVSFKLKQYKPFGTKKVTVQNNKTASVITSRDTSTSPTPKTETTYTVKKGDSLWNIAKSIYGGGSKYTLIAEANKGKITNPSLIYPGQVLTIPKG